MVLGRRSSRVGCRSAAVGCRLPALFLNPAFNRDRQEDVAFSKFDDVLRQVPSRKLAGAAAIPKLPDLVAIEIVDLLSEKRERRVGVRPQAVTEQLFEDLGAKPHRWQRVEFR
jgi:hypothetical protein